ncbi:MAG TPA: hypothetical protein VFR67_21005 [Pilimelia sp.]|nr:hypothetical protein [Pilimelia sp.]
MFFDDFETDRGWTTNPGGTDTATTGAWERGDPEPTDSSGPKQLGTTVNGVIDLVTGRAAGTGPGAFDIDGGTTSVRSPAITLPTGATLTLTLSAYLAHGSNSTADFLRVSVVHSGGTAVVLTRTGAATDMDAAWTAATASLTPYAGQSIRLLIEATASLVEAGVDNIEISRS